MVSEEEMIAARAALAARTKGSTRLGGKGTVRRKKKVVSKSNAAENSKLQGALKKLGAQQVGSISEVQMFMDDDTVMVFDSQPKLQANVAANTFAVTGSHTIKKASEVGGSEMDFAELQRLMQSKKSAGDSAPAEGAGAENDGDVPELVDDFEKFAQLD